MYTNQEVQAIADQHAEGKTALGKALRGDTIFQRAKLAVVDKAFTKSKINGHSNLNGIQRLLAGDTIFSQMIGKKSIANSTTHVTEEEAPVTPNAQPSTLSGLFGL
jgi:hypothetical protein